jgi:hypothetical protein
MKERPILMRGPLVCATIAGHKTVTRRLDGLDDVNVWPDAWKLGESGVADGEHWQTLVDKEDPDLIVNVRSGQGAPGDRLWVRETWAVGACADSLLPAELHPGTWLNDNGGLWYPADNTEPKHPISPRGKTRVSIHMPRWASRVSLEVVSIRYERLSSITADDALAEGITIPTNEKGEWLVELAGSKYPAINYIPHRTDRSEISLRDDIARAYFASLWDGINAERGYGWDVDPWVRRVEFKLKEGK